MANFAILRVQKLKSTITVHRSMKHAFRAQETPNADPEFTPDNTHIGAHSVAEAMAAFRSRLPEKYRSDAVLAIEYLVTASPEVMKEKTRDQQDAYFHDSIQWLRDKHGAENVVYAGIHRDEKTPHLYAYVVPRVGKALNCRQFLGGVKALSDMQTDFAQRVGLKHGLQRGLEGSRAHHTTLKQHYARVNEETPPERVLDVPDPSLGDRLNPRAYGLKVARSVLEQMTPALQILQAKAKETDLAKKQATEAREAFADQDKRLKPLVDMLRPLNQVERRQLVEVARDAGEKILAVRQEAIEAQRRERQAQRTRSRGRDRGGWSL